MTRNEAMLRLIRDVQADVRDYGSLRQLLENQFQSAVRHETSRLNQLANEIVVLVDTLDSRREDRVMLIHALTGETDPHNIQGVLAQLTANAHDTLTTQWQALEALVRECKSLNTRNCELIVEQNAIMQRVLHGEDSIYAAN